MGRRRISRLEHFQNVILEHYWPDAPLAPDCVEGSNYIVPYKYYSRPTFLYHYTDENAAVSILDGDDPCGFAFTHYRYLNDNAEFTRGLQLAIDWLRKRGGGVFPPWFVEKVDSFVKSHAEDQSRIPYVLSFTVESDSTPQWMSYTDKHSGGFAIGVKFDKVEKMLDAVEGGHLHDFHYGKILFAPCIYCAASEEKDVKSFEDILDVAFSSYGEMLNKETDEDRIEWCANRLFQFAAIVKSDAFRFEQEWRIVIRPQDADYIKQLKFIGGKPRLQPTILSLKECVNAIVVSPHGNRGKHMLTAKLLVMKLGKNFKPQKSHSSYVGG